MKSIELILYWAVIAAAASTNFKRTSSAIDGCPTCCNGKDGRDGISITGPPGRDGRDGRDGKDCEECAKGPRGQKGEPGTQGFAGNRGSQGPEGKKGEKGDNGLNGLDGNPGLQGPLGQNGAKGMKGEIGEQGKQGDQGKPGNNGNQGAKGSTGNQGEKGQKGDEGHCYRTMGQGLTCKSLKDKAPSTPSGIYYLTLPSGVHRVYCEMGINGGGYTFLPPETVQTMKAEDLKLLFKNPKDVLLRIARPDGSQPYTVLTQLYDTGGMRVMLSSHHPKSSGPINKMGPYLHLETQPDKSIKNKEQTGFKSNGHTISYTTCDATMHNQIAFFPNPNEVAASDYFNNDHYEKVGLAVEWRKTGQNPPSGRRIPLDFFMFTEIHYGACGCYTSSDRWLSAVSPAHGTAIGLRHPKSTGPVNKMGPYLHLETQPDKAIKEKDTTGFKSNGKTISYTSCGFTLHNQIALFPNPNEIEPSTYHRNDNRYETVGLAVEWRKTARNPASGRRIPLDFFMFTEMHYGACGCYTSSERWPSAVSPAQGTAIGLR